MCTYDLTVNVDRTAVYGGASAKSRRAGNVPRPKTNAWYAVRVGELAEEGLRPPTIAKRLEQEARDAGRHDSPSERTVRRLFEVHAALAPAVKIEQELLRWPASFGTDRLPWEAARDALDLLQFRDGAGLAPPTVGQARWFWRLRLARPSLPLEEANSTSWTLAAAEYLEQAGFKLKGPTGLDLYLAYEPWASHDHDRAYQTSVQRRPGTTLNLTFSIMGTTEELNAASAVMRSYTAGLQRPRGRK